jgi:hypothetical protein
MSPTKILQVMKDPVDGFIEQLVLALFQPILDSQRIRALQSVQTRSIYIIGNDILDNYNNN